MKQYQMSSKEEIDFHKILFCTTSEIDYSMDKLLIIEGDKYDEFILLEGEHCSCYDFDETIWDATLLENREELFKILENDLWGLRVQAYNFICHYFNRRRNK